VFIFLHSNINRCNTNDVSSSLSHVIVYVDTNGRRHLPIHASPAERDAYHTTHHAAVCLPIHQVASPVAYADTNDRRQCLRYITSTNDRRQCLRYITSSTTRHVLSLSYSCAQRAAPSTIQSTIWWSERVDVSLVLPARGCLRGIGGCRCTPITVVVIVGYRWAGRLM
jgi:hypothetical protein